MVVFVGSAAFAEIDSDYVPSEAEKKLFEFFMDGADGPFFKSIGDIEDEALLNALGALLEGLEDSNYVVGILTFIFENWNDEGNKLLYNLGIAESIYNFALKEFQTRRDIDGELTADGKFWLDLLTKHFNFVDANPVIAAESPMEVMLVSVKEDGGSEYKKRSRGCSAFPATAFALFLLPALALVKRGKK